MEPVCKGLKISEKGLNFLFNIKQNEFLNSVEKCDCYGMQDFLQPKLLPSGGVWRKK